ncbi:amidohydrolase family protein [Fulvivirga maritima]|uniref:amidohydrolase family protein n=1 Tax=Fulvivirga maritima TaxID=2904247 RepID=UPI001F444B69|nr:amidohydrolase family protein [Fulvivirga maritima]UII24713.1 amidohydrolase family protein [Fulvivirga maritima]
MKEVNSTFSRRHMLVLLLFFTVLTTAVHGQDLPAVTSTYVIKNVNIIQGPGRKIEMGSLVIKDGVITAVGKSVQIPAEAQVVEADSMYVYAGFIEGLSHTGQAKPKEESRGRGRSDVKDPGNPPNDIAGIEPEKKVSDLLDASDKSVADMRELGFTAANVVPYGRMLPGKGALILLSGESADDMLYRDNTVFFSQLDGAPGVYPSTVMAVMAKYRELYRQAEQAKAYEARYTKDAAGMSRPNTSRVLEAFYPVLEKQQRVAFKAEDILDIERVLVLKKDLGFNLILSEVKQGWDLTDKIKASGAEVLLSLDLPELEEEKADSTKTDSTAVEEKEKTEVDIEREQLEARKKQMILNYYTQPALFKSKGIEFGFSTLGVKSNDIKGILIKLIENGLTEDQALAALTTSPAKILGVSSIMGTVDEGKMANFFITDKPYFDKESNVKYTFVDGQMYKFKDKPGKKGKGGKGADIKGKWSYSSETPQGVISGVITFNGEPGDYSGSISNSSTNESTDFTDITVDGNSVVFSFSIVSNGETLKITITMNIEGETFEGTMTAGEYGSFPIEGDKMPEDN